MIFYIFVYVCIQFHICQKMTKIHISSRKEKGVQPVIACEHQSVVGTPNHCRVWL